MLSLHRLAAAATAAVATVAVAPAAAQERISPDARDGWPRQSTSLVERVSPDARYGVPDGRTPTLVVDDAPSSGFAWADAAVGGGAAVALLLVIAGCAIAVRSRHPTAIR